jgi:PKD domain
MVIATAFVPASDAWADPVASFRYEPQRPLTHQPVTLTSTGGSDSEEGVTSQAWDLDDDGRFDDARGATATVTFPRPGPHGVALRVVDSAGNDDTHREVLPIGNQTPVVSMVPVPGDPSPGQPVTFASTSSDPDGLLTSYGWDLDEDGDFDDAAGSSVTVVFPPSGRYRVGLRVVDDAGASATMVLVIDRAGGIDAAAGAQAIPRLMSPFPVVRVSGIVRKRGIKLRLLSVTGPVGASVRLRCRGGGCPFRSHSRTLKGRTRSAAGTAPSAGSIRTRRFSRRVLAVGATLKVSVTAPDAIGKYTRLKVRKGRLPARVDRCILPAARASVPCPTG